MKNQNEFKLMSKEEKINYLVGLVNEAREEDNTGNSFLNYETDDRELDKEICEVVEEVEKQTGVRDLQIQGVDDYPDYFLELKWKWLTNAEREEMTNRIMSLLDTNIISRVHTDFENEIAFKVSAGLLDTSSLEISEEVEEGQIWFFIYGWLGKSMGSFTLPRKYIEDVYMSSSKRFKQSLRDDIYKNLDL